MAVDVQKIRLNGCRTGRVTKLKATRNLFGTTSEDHETTNAWLKAELEKTLQEDRKKLESLGLDPDTEKPVENSRWEWTVLDGKTCPKLYRSTDMFSKYANISGNSSETVVCTHTDRLLDSIAMMDCSTASSSTHHEPSSSKSPKKFKQTTITDFLQKRRMLSRSRRKSVSNRQKSNSQPAIDLSPQQHPSTDA